MKLLRYGPPGQEKPGLLDAAGRIRDRSGIVPDIAGDTLTPGGIATIDPATLPLIRGTPRHGACIGAVGNVMRPGIAGLGEQTQRVVAARA